MDWPSAAVIIVGILSALAAHAINTYSSRDADTEAIGFHTDFIGREDDE